MFADQVIESLLGHGFALVGFLHHDAPDGCEVLNFLALSGSPLEHKVGLTGVFLPVQKMLTPVVPALSPVTMEVVQDILALQQGSGHLPFASSSRRQTESVSVIRHGPIGCRIPLDASEVEVWQEDLLGIFLSDVNRRLSLAVDRDRKLLGPGELFAMMPRIIETHFVRFFMCGYLFNYRKFQFFCGF